MTVPYIDIQRISKQYRTPQGVVRALHEISFSANEGEFIAVQGPSGCGKTTLLLSIGGLLAPDLGKVVIGGVDHYALSPDARAKFRAGSIGFVFQQFHLIPYLTVHDNILVPEGALPHTDSHSRAKELMARFNLTSRAGHYPAELSTGERQRTALARALLSAPHLLLADEPTGNLDRDNAVVALAAFVAFAEAGGSVLLATHEDGIAKEAHRVIRLREGGME